MKQSLALLTFFSVILVCESLLAMPKSAVLMSGPSGAKGTEGQLQYNDAGKTAGADINYDKTTGNIGIGTTAPSSKLEVRGEIRSTDSNGNNRLWGQGRPNVQVEGAWNISPANADVEYAYSLHVATWYASPAVCPANTWVCSLSDDLGRNQRLRSIPTYSYAIGCNGSIEEQATAWVADGSEEYEWWGATRNEDFSSKMPPCANLKVWCCREKLAP